MCGKPSEHVHHLYSRGAGGPDEEWNLAPLCAKDHRKVHSYGLNYMCFNYKFFKNALITKGWSYNNFLGRWVYVREDEKDNG